VSAQASPALLEVAAALDTVIREDALVLDPRRQMADLDVLAQVRNACDYALFRALRAAQSEALSGVGGRTARSWLMEECRLPKATVDRYSVLLRCLDQFEQTEDAFAAGRINLEHTAAVVRALLTLPIDMREVVEPVLLLACDENTPEEVTKLVDELLEGMGYDKESDRRRERRFTQRGVDFHAVAHRTYAMTGTLMPEVAEVLKLALHAADPQGGEEDTRTPRQRMHDALAVIAQHFLEHADVPIANGERPRLVVTIRREDLQLEGAAGVAAMASLASGTKIPLETARRLACDAGVIPVVLGGRSEVLDLGRTSRGFSSACRKAALIQQGGKCAYPKCRRPVMECHHIVWWSRGGASNLDNAAWLCAFHHWLVHEGKWEMRRDESGFTFTNPYGDTRHRCISAA
jgi:Domain of unknown function (DUF222)